MVGWYGWLCLTHQNSPIGVQLKSIKSWWISWMVMVPWGWIIMFWWPPALPTVTNTRSKLGLNTLPPMDKLHWQWRSTFVLPKSFIESAQWYFLCFVFTTHDVLSRFPWCFFSRIRPQRRKPLWILTTMWLFLYGQPQNKLYFYPKFLEALRKAKSSVCGSFCFKLWSVMNITGLRGSVLSTVFEKS